MRHKSSILAWIPSEEAIGGSQRLPFDRVQLRELSKDHRRTRPDRS